MGILHVRIHGGDVIARGVLQSCEKACFLAKVAREGDPFDGKGIVRARLLFHNVKRPVR